MRQSVQGKRIFPGGQNSFVPHFAKLFGKRTAVDIQIVRQPLSVKRNLKMIAAGAPPPYQAGLLCANPLHSPFP